MRPNLAILRAALAPMLTEAGTVERLDSYTLDEASGLSEPSYELVWSGPLLIRQQSSKERVAQVGGVSITLTRYDVTFPAEASIPEDGILTLTSAALDPELVGAQFRIVSVPLDPWGIARYAAAERRT